jgi:hypothetical protein
MTRRIADQLVAVLAGMVLGLILAAILAPGAWVVIP